jgi:hypothetical protein
MKALHIFCHLILKDNLLLTILPRNRLYPQYLNNRRTTVHQTHLPHDIERNLKKTNSFNMPVFPFKIRKDGLLSRLSPRPANPQATHRPNESGAYISRQPPQHQSHDSVPSGVEINRLEEHPIEMKSRAAQLVDGKIIPGTDDI